MAAAAEEAAGSGGGSPASARRRLRIISGHLRGSPPAAGREALSPSPCKARGGSAGPVAGSIPKKRWVRAGAPREAGLSGTGRAAGSGLRARWGRKAPWKSRESGHWLLGLSGVLAWGAARCPPRSWRRSLVMKRAACKEGRLCAGFLCSWAHVYVRPRGCY